MRDTTLRLVETSEATPARTALQAQGLIYEARGRRLIDRLDLSVASGRVTVLLGANGAGKSLALRLLHGLIVPHAGEIRWRDRPLDRAARRAQAMVFQRPVMLRRSVMANLTFALAVRGFGGRERARRATEALEAARLADLAHRPARVLSGGEQQRLALARALACEPELLLLDEPTANLDPASTLAIEEQIRTARGRGITVLLVTHDQGQARRIADDIAFMHAGRVVEAGSAFRVLNAPRSHAAQAWLEGRLELAPADLGQRAL